MTRDGSTLRRLRLPIPFWVTAFGATEIPVGQAGRTEVHPGRFAEDALIFAVPEDGIGVRLRLPASAWNGAGELKFFIPATMIQR